MSERKKIYQQETVSDNLVNKIVSSQDIKLELKLTFLQFLMMNALLNDDNLLYLECKQAIKELNV